MGVGSEASRVTCTYVLGQGRIEEGALGARAPPLA